MKGHNQRGNENDVTFTFLDFVNKYLNISTQQQRSNLKLPDHQLPDTSCTKNEYKAL